MMITKIVLNNIKSYVHEEIDFSQGINCILGLNGSGKSTIIESIGFAIFNFNKVSANQLLRYNENKGSIEVEFIANDDRKYKVIRTIRAKSSSVKIIDCQTNSQLYDNVADVYSFIKKILKVRKTKEFSKMFEEIIAVPQGQYVNAFLEKSTARKENFDKLFDLHIYKETANKVKDIIDNLKRNQIKMLENDIENINGQVISYDVKKDNLEKLVTELCILNEDKMKLSKLLETTKNQKNRLEISKSNLDRLTTEKVLINAKLDNINALINQTRVELNNADNANIIVKDNLTYYLRYEENIKSIGEFETKYKDHVAGENKLVELKNNLSIINNDINNLQEKVQEKNNEIDGKLKQQKVLNTQIFAKQLNLDDLKKMYNDKSESNEAKYISLNNNIDKEKRIIIDLENYRNRYIDINIYDVSIYHKNKELIKECQDKLEIIKAKQKEIVKLDKEYDILTSEYEINKQNTALTIDGTCPILKEKCMNIGGQSLSKYFADKMIEVDKKRQNIYNEIEAIKANMEDENELIINIQNYQQYQQLFENASQRIKGLEADFKNKYNYTLNPKEIDKAINIHQNNIHELEKSLANEEVIKRQLVNDYIEINSINLKINTELENIKKLEKEAKELEKAVSELHNKITQKQIEQNRLQKDINNLSSNLNKDQDMKVTLEKLKKETDSLLIYRDKYLANIEKAKDSERLLNRLNELKDEKIRLENQLLLTREEIIKIEADYSNELLSETVENYNKLNQDVKVIETSIFERDRVKNDLQIEIENMENLIKERSNKANDLIRLNNIVEFLINMRSIYTNLPLKLSQTYREYIASMATNLYRQIASENVRLEILEDYEIRIIDDEEKENYKRMEQLSGGEQMSVALAIRLSMLKHLTGLDIYFLDEPTINLDIERRQRIGEVIQDISQELSQLFVISHDDTFDSITDIVIKIEKIENSSKSI